MTENANSMTATIVMYHYVRDLPRTTYPRIKGLLTSRFEGQLDYLARHYTIVSLSDLLAASRGQSSLPANACVLTFDDGFIDHYQTVFPALQRRGFSGAFFPPAKPLQEHRVLDVHKIQFLLAASRDHRALERELLEMVEERRGDFSILPAEELRAKFAVGTRFDPPEVIFVKRLLQWALPSALRASIASQLFRKYISADEVSFARELYVSMDQLREMAAAGMEIGGHGYAHEWLGNLDFESQREEITRTVAFLKCTFGRELHDWVMCYPYGNYNDHTIALLAERGCAMGLTTKVGKADLSHLLELQRLDTNDLPSSGDAPESDWTATAHG